MSLSCGFGPNLIITRSAALLRTPLRWAKLEELAHLPIIVPSAMAHTVHKRFGGLPLDGRPSIIVDYHKGQRWRNILVHWLVLVTAYKLGDLSESHAQARGRRGLKER